MKANKSRSKTIINGIIIIILVVAIYKYKATFLSAFVQMKQVALWQLLLAFLASMIYQVIDGINVASLVKVHNPKFRFIDGVWCMLYTSFYRVISFGSAQAIATTYYLSKNDVSISKGTGISAINYMLHKMMIAILCIIFFILGYSSISNIYGGYFHYLIYSLILVFIVCMLFLLFCTSEKFHNLIAKGIQKLNRNGKLDNFQTKMNEQMDEMRCSSIELLKDKKRIAWICFYDIFKLLSWYVIPYIFLINSTGSSLFICLAIMSFVVAIAGVMVAPAGIGTLEFVFMLLFAGMASNDKLLLAILLYRFFAFVVPGLVGVIVVIVHKLFIYKNEHYINKV
ncbi:lysylphosphatidylglycerol synthase transmembrane domain-containing protein [[Clostridium] fimetarium]|uniref:Phosphatidylglycerol lysyltransferase n=1 Tax=[Clostridium] fimetarium TaxID=99656 RepID=A0A1I0N0F0_9FIRM|nr:lysylphosphatidylglycerol synthase domain-containing protein [[Clostridium] fimetarium]SEV93819.1 hypothetical protein SAMN05421659_102251 [[Clostridium] fimetarium]